MSETTSIRKLIDRTASHLRPMWLIPSIDQIVTVLIVEEDVVTAQVLSTCAQGCGINTIMAPTIAQALQSVEDADVLVVDQDLPNGLGSSLLSDWEYNSGGPCLVTVRGQGREEECRSLIVAGADHVLARPVQPHILLTYMRRYKRQVLNSRELSRLHKEVTLLRRWMLGSVILIVLTFGEQVYRSIRYLDWYINH